MNDSKSIDSVEALEDLFDAFNRHDRSAVMAYFADDAVFFTAAGPEVHGSRVEGSGAIGEAFENVWSAMPDANWAHRGHLVHGNRAVSEWTFTGTGQDGSRVEAEGADIFTLRNGKIVVKQAFRKNRT